MQFDDRAIEANLPSARPRISDRVIIAEPSSMTIRTSVGYSLYSVVELFALFIHIAVDILSLRAVWMDRRRPGRLVLRMRTIADFSFVLMRYA